MYIDAFLRVMIAQAFTAVAVSVSSIDLGNVTPKRQIGTGEAMGFGVSVDVAASATTVLLEIISATDAALTAGILVHASVSKAAALYAVGTLHHLGLPLGTPTQRYLGLRVTPVGGAETVTLTGWLTPNAMMSVAPEHYARNYAV